MNPENLNWTAAELAVLRVAAAFMLVLIGPLVVGVVAWFWATTRARGWACALVAGVLFWLGVWVWLGPAMAEELWRWVE